MTTPDKLSPWFTHAPWEPGVYEREHDSGTAVFSLWTGHNWMMGSLSVDRAAKVNEVSRWPEDTRWRGLAEKPQ